MCSIFEQFLRGGGHFQVKFEKAHILLGFLRIWVFWYPYQLKPGIYQIGHVWSLNHHKNTSDMCSDKIIGMTLAF